jgi:hypothetical protein
MAKTCSPASLITPISSEALQDTLPISEAMKALSSVKPMEELTKDRTSKPNHIEIGRSTLKDKDLQTMKKPRYFSNKANV